MGLWPSSDSNFVSNCQNKSKGDLSNYPSSLMNNMNKFWPSFSGKNDKFWNHEWQKHGTCIDFKELRNDNLKYKNFDNERIYFEKTIDLFMKLRLETLFK